MALAVPFFFGPLRVSCKVLSRFELMVDLFLSIANRSGKG
jgi:hypothetical protein